MNILFRSFLICTLVLLLASPIFAAGSNSVFLLDGWLEVTRAISTKSSFDCYGYGVSGVCGTTGAISEKGGENGQLQTMVTLTFRNAGTADRTGIIATESLSIVPEGAKLWFSQEPDTFDGRGAAWSVGDLKAGQSKSVSYSFAATFSEGAEGRIPQTKISTAPLSVSISAPSSVKVGEIVAVSLRTQTGQPVSDATILVSGPDGSSYSIKTNIQGKASFVASRSGFHTYSVSNCRLLSMVSTNALEKELPAPIVGAASAADSGIVPAIIGVLPIIAGLFVVAVILLIAYNFIAASRSREQDDSPLQPNPRQPEPLQPASPSQASPMSYTQKFSFAESEKQDQHVQDVTREIIGNRKKQLEAQSQPADVHSDDEIQASEADPGSPEDGENADKADSEKESADAEENQDLEALPSSMREFTESTSTSDGDSEKLALLSDESGDAEASETEENESIEATITRLEEIRAKLQARRQGMEAGALEQDEAGEPEDSEKPEEDSSDEELPDAQPESADDEAEPAKAVRKRVKAAPKAKKAPAKKGKPVKKKGRR